MNYSEALAIVGSLSAPSKMPCHGWSISAKRCITGGKLHASAPDSICAKCYALKGRYLFPNVQAAQEIRYRGLSHPKWAEAMATVILRKERSGFFRWFDSGDLQSVAHLYAIAKVCELTPEIRHWLPTKEFGFVREYLKRADLPANLNVRLSSYLRDGSSPDKVARDLGVTVSAASDDGFSCPSSKQGNKCGDCRACWLPEVFKVTYKTH